MKKSKFLIYAAVAATAAIVSSCSNEDVVEQTPQKGRPIVVEASVDGSSRATVATSFTGFKLYGYKDNTEKTNFLDGVNFAKSNSSWVSVGSANWPEGSGNCNFYAISTQGAAGVPDGIDITNLKDGSFSYTVPADVAAQQDILVANHNDVAYADNSGKIKLGFKHALANVTMQVRFNYREWKAEANSAEKTTSSMSQGEILSFDRITFHNVYTSGTFNASTGTWTPTGTKGDVVIAFDEPTNFPSVREEVTATTNNYQDIVFAATKTNSTVMFIPQTPTAYWTPSSSSKLTAANTAGLPYIEIHGLTYTTDADEPVSPLSYTLEELNAFVDEGAFPFELAVGDNTEEGMEHNFADSYYIPLPDGFKFEVNKNYNIRLNFMNAYDAAGSHIYKGTNFVVGSKSM